MEYEAIFGGPQLPHFFRSRLKRRQEAARLRHDRSKGAGTLVFSSSIRQPIGMETTKNGWTILDADQAVLSREYSFTPGALARTIVARQHEGEALTLMSPPNDLDDAALSDLEQFGKVTSIIANNGMHHMGLPRWQERFLRQRSMRPKKRLPALRRNNRCSGSCAHFQIDD